MDTRKIIEREVERIKSAPEGTRNVTFNKVAYTLGGYAHLGISESEAQQECHAAAIAAGMEEREISLSWRSGWTEGQKHPCDIPMRTTREILYDFDSIVPCIDVDCLDEQPVTEPEVESYDGRHDLIRYLEAVYEPEEYVGYCVSARFQEDRQKWVPASGGVSDRTAAQLITELKATQDIGAVLGDYDPEAGAWIKFNPLDGSGGVKDENVTVYRYALVEGDDGNIDRQAAIYEALQLPCAAIVHSGKKSLHAIVRVDAKDLPEYRARVKYLYAVLEKNGLEVDPQNKNPSRLSRLPGVTRAGKPQFLIKTNVGQPDWEAWKDYIAELNDSLPDFEPICDVWYNMPLKAPELIKGILRQGHKMLLAGPSKAGKSFLLLELAICIAEMKKWLGCDVAQGRILYVNLELDHASCLHRIKDLYSAMEIKPQNIANIDIWQLRGKALPLDQLVAPLIRRAKIGNYKAMIIDPLYKILTGDENSAHEMAKFCNHFDRICMEVGCSTIYCHHHSKGQQGQKRSGDRASGSGVFLRDPDAMLDLIELDIDQSMQSLLTEKYKSYNHEVSPTISAWRIEGTLREFPPPGKINLLFDYPLHYVDSLNLLSGEIASGEAPPRTASKKDRIRNAVRALDGDLSEGINITELCESAGMEQEEIRSWCANSVTPYWIGHDDKMRLFSAHRPLELLWAFREARQTTDSVLPKNMADALNPESKRTEQQVRKWLQEENKLFIYQQRKPVQLTKYGEQKCNELFGSEDAEEEELF